MVDSFSAGETTRDSVQDRDQAAADRSHDAYGTSRNTPWGPQSAWSGLKGGGLLGALLGAINDPSMPKTMGDPGGYNTRDGGGRVGGSGGLDINSLLAALQQGGQGGQGAGGFPFQFGMPPSQVTPNFMPQITPPGGMPTEQGPQNLNDLYGLYGVAPNAPMPVAPPGPSAATAPAPSPPPVAPPPYMTVPPGENIRNITPFPGGLGGFRGIR